MSTDVGKVKGNEIFKGIRDWVVFTVLISIALIFIALTNIPTYQNNNWDVKETIVGRPENRYVIDFDRELELVVSISQGSIRLIPLDERKEMFFSRQINSTEKRLLNIPERGVYANLLPPGKYLVLEKTGDVMFLVTSLSGEEVNLKSYPSDELKSEIDRKAKLIWIVVLVLIVVLSMVFGLFTIKSFSQKRD